MLLEDEYWIPSAYRDYLRRWYKKQVASQAERSVCYWERGREEGQDDEGTREKG